MKMNPNLKHGLCKRLRIYTRFLLSLTTVLIVCTVLPGCWDYHELDKDASVQTFAYDLTSRGIPEITVELQRAGQKARQSGKGKEGGSAPMRVQGQGETFYDAVKNVSDSLPAVLDFSHHECSIFNDKVLQSPHFKEVMDRVTRYSTARRRVLLFATTEPAESLLKLTIPLSNGIGHGLNGLALQSKMQQSALTMDVNEFLFQLSTPGIQPLMPRLEVSQLPGMDEPKIEAAGSAAFRGIHLAGWLTEDETRGVLWVRNQSGHPVMTMPWRSGKATFITQNISAKVVPQGSTPSSGHTSFVITVKWKGALEMYSSTIRLKPEDALPMQQAVAQFIKQEIQLAIIKAQSLHADVLGLGNALYRADPKGFHAVYQGRWDTGAFPQAQIHIVVQSTITGFGFTTNSIESK